ncbi:MAG: hypothetical protein J7K00_05495 [Candidatus Diapherotrites archaeon]|nr:hypothetical protein [Candidatus Diapherotrites archaeon]
MDEKGQAEIEYLLMTVLGISMISVAIIVASQSELIVNQTRTGVQSIRETLLINS